MGKISGAKKSNLGGHLTINEVNWQQVSDMTGLKKDIREAESLRNNNGHGFTNLQKKINKL